MHCEVQNSLYYHYSSFPGESDLRHPESVFVNPTLNVTWSSTILSLQPEEEDCKSQRRDQILNIPSTLIISKQLIRLFFNLYEKNIKK